jgi:hypothetical protein
VGLCEYLLAYDLKTGAARGTAGPIVQLTASLPLVHPDGLRAVGRNVMLQAEGQGRLAEITIAGDRAEVRVVKDGLTGATAVTLVGDTALVLVARLKAVTVPYRLIRPAS